MFNRQVTTRKRTSQASGFTLIELLIVIAITSVLIFLIFGPLIQGFSLTARAQTTTQAQDAARVAMEQITREMGSASAIRDTSHQFLHMLMYKKDGTEVVSNAYNAYIDIVPPRAAQGTYSDPTYNPSDKTITLKQSTNGSQTLTYGTSVLPVAPGTTIVRYFIGLRFPIDTTYTGTGATQEQPYTNRDEGQTIARTDPTYKNAQVVKSNINNSYILYRAEVEPYQTVVVKNGNTTHPVNANYFAADSSGNPILDDPDFFRITGVAAHDARVYHWFQAAKPIIDVGDANLIFQPHDGKGNVVYDSTSLLPAGTQLDTDGITPLMRTSVSFAPATISNDPMNATATSDVSQGYGASPADSSSVGYIPTQFRAQYDEWQGGINVQINQNIFNSASNTNTSTLFNTFVASGTTAPTGTALGDLIEATSTGTNVYDVSSGAVLNSATNYVVMSVDGDSGTVDFALPDIPFAGASKTAGTGPNIVGAADPSNQVNPYWFITYGQQTSSAPIYVDIQPNPMNGTAATDPYLLQNASTLTQAATVQNGRVVVNSERVYGPEEDPGPGSADPAVASSGYPVTYSLVPYKRIPFTPGADAEIKADQYMIDYDTGTIYLGLAGSTLNLGDAYAERRTVLVAFSYQNNISTYSGAASQADTVRATYQTGSQIEVSLGIRVYDPSDKHPTYFSLTSRVRVGNASR